MAVFTNLTYRFLSVVELQKKYDLSIRSLSEHSRGLLGSETATPPRTPVGEPEMCGCGNGTTLRYYAGVPYSFRTCGVW